MFVIRFQQIGSSTEKQASTHRDQPSVCHRAGILDPSRLHVTHRDSAAEPEPHTHTHTVTMDRGSGPGVWDDSVVFGSHDEDQGVTETSFILETFLPCLLCHHVLLICVMQPDSRSSEAGCLDKDG